MRITYTAPIKLDLGCGAKKKEGYTGVDMVDFGQEIVFDVRNGIPVPDDSVEDLFSSHFVEHLEERDIFMLFSEFLRICKDGAEIKIICPEASTEEAYFDCHRSLWHEKRIRGICRGKEGIKEVDGYFEIVDFHTAGIEMICTLKVIK